MKKFVLAAVILFLVLSTAVIKNTTKQIEDELFTAKENIRVLKSEFENISLEYDYLSSSEKLLDFQSLYFENDLVQKKIENIKVFKVPGSFELIYGAKKAQHQKPDVVIVLGSIIQGETKHFDFICQAVK